MIESKFLRLKMIDQTYMIMTSMIASFSRAKRLKTAAIIVKDGVVISTGFNGTPKGAISNDCEYINEEGLLTTVPWVLHGEHNAINNLVMSSSGSSIKDSTMYTLHSPCFNCAALIKHVGISRVVYLYEYRLTDPLKWLIDNGVAVEKCIISDDQQHLISIEQIMKTKNLSEL